MEKSIVLGYVFSLYHIPLLIFWIGIYNVSFFIGKSSMPGLICFSVFVGLGLIVLAIILLRKFSLFIGYFWFLVALSFGICIPFSSYYYYIQGEYTNHQISNISVQDAPNYSKMDIFYFTDGQVDASYMGEYLYHTKNSYKYYCAAPIIYDNWTVDIPVTLWGACFTGSKSCSSAYRSGYNDCIRKWKYPIRIGVKVDSSMSGGASVAIKHAKSDYHLLSVSHAPVVYWNDPLTIFSEFETYFLVALILPNVLCGVVLIGTVCYHLIILSRSKNYETV
eukprot:TRINITY_DN692_c0_g1_i1.p1 TRINITY_DN692_c0_g1~~TRINITY_DN692_c0_g1_i1.p1  ORF type:complete len:278 (-),score=3.47 TRINITY_DN692_c0_g1_i1:9-842(-)